MDTGGYDQGGGFGSEEGGYAATGGYFPQGGKITVGELGPETVYASGPTSVSPYSSDIIQNALRRLPSPNQINYSQYRSMMPSEQGILQGLVEEGGGYYPDYLQGIIRGAPLFPKSPQTRYAPLTANWR